MRSKSRQPFPWLQGALLLLALLVFLGLVGEIAMRLGDLRGARVPGTQDGRCSGAGVVLDDQKGVFRLDPAAGYLMAPNLCLRLRSEEYDEVLRTNSRGFVGPEVPDEKRAGEQRVVILGDSYTAGGQVPAEAAFSAVLEDLLHEAGLTQVQVVNAGVGGWTTRNQAGFLEANLDWLQPDVVIVASFLGNDVSENVLSTAGGYQLLADHPDGFGYGEPARDLVAQSQSWFPRNGLPLPEDLRRFNPAAPLPTPVPNSTTIGRTTVKTTPGPIPQWVQDPSAVNTARNVLKWLWESAREHSRVLGAVFGNVGNKAVTTAPGAGGPSKYQVPLNISGSEWLILRERPAAYWVDAAWPLFGSYLSRIRTTAESAGAPTLLVAIPTLAQFDDRARARLMADFRFTEDELDWERPQRELRQQAERAGVPHVIDLLPLFKARQDRADLYFPLDQHFTTRGHRATAEVIAGYLIEKGLLHR